jgi:prepilin-type N-terminal cleavage/methylation domain-containing protein
MKISRTFLGRVAPPGRSRIAGLGEPSLPVIALAQSAFTMVEIAICLAIIGIALVAIIGILPLGIDVQKDNREETIINQDATVLIEAIRNGARGADDLTNYVYAIVITNTCGKAFNDTNLLAGPMNYSSGTANYITNGARIIGLLSTPEYVDGNGLPIPNLSYTNQSCSNHIVAYVRSISGPAVEKPPQNNDIVTGGSFGYRIICENVPVAVDTNAFNSINVFDRVYAANLTANLHELRLTFQWPLLPNGKIGLGHQTFRTTIAGQIVTNIDAGQILYFFQSQSFTNAP